MHVECASIPLVSYRFDGTGCIQDQGIIPGVQQQLWPFKVLDRDGISVCKGDFFADGHRSVFRDFPVQSILRPQDGQSGFRSGYLSREVFDKSIKAFVSPAVPDKGIFGAGNGTVLVTDIKYELIPGNKWAFGCISDGKPMCPSPSLFVYVTFEVKQIFTVGRSANHRGINNDQVVR